jgi:hypothetical protein
MIESLAMNLMLDLTYLKLKSSYYRNSKLRISFVPTKWFLVGKMDSYETWWEKWIFISLVLVPWYSKLAFNGLIELFVVLVSSTNLGNLSKNN